MCCPPWTKGHKPHQPQPLPSLKANFGWALRPIHGSGLPSTEGQATYTILGQWWMYLPLVSNWWISASEHSYQLLAHVFSLRDLSGNAVNDPEGISLSGGGCHCFFWQSALLSTKGPAMSVPFRPSFPKLFLIDLQIFQRVLQLLWVNKTLSLRSETLDSSCPLPSSSKLRKRTTGSVTSVVS